MKSNDSDLVRDPASGFLVIVSGLPAAGKTSLSERLGRDLGFPVVHRDRLRRYVFNGLDEVPEVRDLLPEASDRLVLGVMSSVLDAGIGVVLDGNFNTERHMTPVRNYITRRQIRAAEVCLWGEPDVLRRRFIARAEPPLTRGLESYFEDVLHRPRESVLAEPAHVEHLDTTDLSVLDTSYEHLRKRLEVEADGLP